MAACASTSDCESLDRLVECPVCYEVLSGPKLLCCGHSICNACSNRLTIGTGHGQLQCPVCRVRSDLPLGGLPTNFILADLVTQIVAQKQKRCHKCAVCDKDNSSDSMFVCHSCNRMCLCFLCALKVHNGHNLQQLDDLIKNKRDEFDTWRRDMIGPQLAALGAQKRSLGTMGAEAKQICTELAAQIHTNTTAWIGDGADRLNKKTKEFEDKLAKYGDPREGMLNLQNGYAFNLESLEEELKALSDEHDQVATKQQELMDTLRSCKTKLTALGVPKNTISKSVSSGAIRAQGNTRTTTTAIRSANQTVGRPNRNTQQAAARARSPSSSSSSSGDDQPMPQAAPTRRAANSPASAALQRYLARLRGQEINASSDDDDDLGMVAGSAPMSPVVLDSSPNVSPRLSVSPAMSPLSPSPRVSPSPQASVSPLLMLDLSDDDQQGPSTTTANVRSRQRQTHSFSRKRARITRNTSRVTRQTRESSESD